MTNFFLEDYIKNDNDADINPIPGTNYEIFGNIVRFIGYDQIGKMHFVFAGKAEVSASSKLRKYLRNTYRTRLSRYEDYKSNRQQVLANRSAVSRILEPNEGIRVNDQTLKSKVLLVTGRNNISKFREYIQNTNLCGESLNQIFIRNGNLLLKENLSAFNGLFDDQYELKVLNFIEAFNALMNGVTDPDVLFRLIELSRTLEANGITEDFDQQFYEIANDYGDEISDLKYLKDNFYPGPKSNLLEKFKAVIINDILQFELYFDTINNLIKRGIPIFIISDRLVDFHNNPPFYYNLFARYDACRINWNKGKLQELLRIGDTETNFVDAEFWTTCKRYARQKIEIVIFDGCILDQLMNDLRRAINRFPEYQRLREAYYNFLETAYSLVKNSEKNNELCLYLTNCFREVLNDVKDIINQGLLESMDKALLQIEAFEANTKEMEAGQNYFSVSLTVEGLSITIPNFAAKNNFPDEETEQIVFTGFPYNEPLRYFLHDALCRSFIPDMTILAWPIESELTRAYIKRRLRSGYFTDKNCGGLGLPLNCLLSNDEDFESEIDTTIELCDKRGKNETDERPEALPVDDIDLEGDLVLLARSRFNPRPRDTNAPLVNPVNFHMVVFEDDSYIYMPVASSEGVRAKVMIGRFDKNSGKFIVERIDEGQMEAGQYFFDIDYYVDLPTVLRLTGTNQFEAETLTSSLYLWRQLLREIFEKKDRSLENLTNFLHEIKDDNLDTFKDSNPAIHNLRNWLFNEDILAPVLANIQLIFKAAGYEGPSTPEDIIEIRKNINGRLIRLSHAVKNDIERKFTGKTNISDSNFEYEKNNVKIKCDIKRIASIVRDDLTVEYSATRKVLTI